MQYKPQYADEYDKGITNKVKETCLYVATKLGDLIDDIVIVGGLVPSLLIDQDNIEYENHIGTMDVDLGLALVLLDQEKYKDISHRLREAGFKPDKTERGNRCLQRWCDQNNNVLIDFLIPVSSEGEKSGKIKHLEADFAAIITDGLELAFQDKIRRTLTGYTSAKEKVSRGMWVAGPGAFIVLKALAFRNRGENKDAYDLFYVLHNWENSVKDVASCMYPILGEKWVKEALKILKEDFTAHDGPGPLRAAKFLNHGPDDNIQADVVGDVMKLLDLCKKQMD